MQYLNDMRSLPPAPAESRLLIWNCETAGLSAARWTCALIDHCSDTATLRGVEHRETEAVVAKIVGSNPKRFV